MKKVNSNMTATMNNDKGSKNEYTFNSVSGYREEEINEAV